ncbi:putative ATP-grasp-modified RiPP [Streptomyces ipomoeae]|jgi:putative ATP-grasp target RiPP|uniref:ATP-grasp-modified RiPP n=1 Tax=Streptomyces ipomoeae TaxID=103232 RepID=A0AAE8VV29_9ACTN|nr:putative ATP-grasp-modified RiPP [Streptomyces ipomoeae]MDX2826974.1 putative ATP-grasp-modified RiPP [Streptomyces ipomoeae]MDX2879603.1 putative ATP-grasp-modified RiPP [Streptomyces ipomoeae]TQE20527.1 putative ATP-grasp-modified RiPP [Streptomyces ipomoeae]TQE27930.1 putative ATP-grasp-modified RiPP [Streptomyces ipomoeae]
MQATAPDDQVTPWGVSRMKPFPPAEVLPAARAVLDAETQTAAWVDPDGTLLPTLDKHKRSETSKETTTKTSLDGTPDQGSDQQGDSD